MNTILPSLIIWYHRFIIPPSLELHFMLRPTAVILYLLVAFSFPAVARAVEPASPWSGVVHIVAGERGLDADFWKPVENQQVLGLNVHFGKTDWPIRMLAEAAFSTRTAAATGYDVTGEVREFSFGAVTNFHSDDLTPYVGAGLSWVNVVAKGGTGSASTSATDDAYSIGGFVQAGLAYRFGGRFDVGFDLRYLGGTSVKLFDQTGDADYLQGALLFGWAF